MQVWVPCFRGRKLQFLDVHFKIPVTSEYVPKLVDFRSMTVERGVRNKEKRRRVKYSGLLYVAYAWATINVV